MEVLVLLGAWVLIACLIFSVVNRLGRRQDQPQDQHQDQSSHTPLLAEAGKERQDQPKDQHHFLMEKIKEQSVALYTIIKQNFLVQPCSRCHEFVMRLIELSPNGRSVHYQCVHCGKKMRGAAGTPDASQQAITKWNGLADLVNQYNQISLSPINLTVEFETSPAPLPYEKTNRTPIPEAVRSEVWRRDGGRCVNCGSKENLQFDHIIPVSRGGATSPQNLQLLCQPCNLAKGAKI